MSTTTKTANNYEEVTDDVGQLIFILLALGPTGFVWSMCGLIPAITTGNPGDIAWAVVFGLPVAFCVIVGVHVGVRLLLNRRHKPTWTR